jgi:lysophospholipase L1-like esterase
MLVLHTVMRLLKSSLILCFCCLLLGSGCEKRQAPVQLLFLGDSYTVGSGELEELSWPLQARDRLTAEGYDIAKVEIRAQSGWRSTNLLSDLRSNPLTDAKDWVSVLIGVNDAFLGASVDEFIPSYEELIREALSSVQEEPLRVLAISIPDFAYTPFGQNTSIPPEQISSQIDSFNAYQQSYCEELGIPFIDIVDISRRGLDEPELVSADSLHPSGLQYALWLERILPRMEQALSTD